MATIKREEVPPTNSVKMVTTDQLLTLQNDLRKCNEFLEITMDYIRMGAGAYTKPVVLVTEVMNTLRKADAVLNEWEK